MILTVTSTAHMHPNGYFYVCETDKRWFYCFIAKVFGKPKPQRWVLYKIVKVLSDTTLEVVKS